MSVDGRTTDGREHTAPPMPASRSKIVWSPLIIGVVVGVALIIASIELARTSNGFGHFAVFWLGYGVVLLTVASVAYRFPEDGRLLRWLVGVIAVATFIPKFLMSESSPAYFDEYAHLRHVNDFLATGHIAVHNPILPVVQFYPGLELATSVVHWITRLGTWHSGQIVIFAAHLAAPLLMFGIARQLNFSPRACFAAALVFMLNPSYMYFDSQYAYESLGIPIMLAVVYGFIFVQRGSAHRIVPVTILVCVGSSVTVATHHVTALFMVAFLILCAVFIPPAQAGVDGPDPAARKRRTLGVITVVWAALSTGLWIFVLAGSTRAYVATRASNGLRQLYDRVTGSDSGGASTVIRDGRRITVSTSHQLFQGTSVPGYERIAAYAAPVIVLVLLVLAVRRVLQAPKRWQQLRLMAPALIFAIGYLVSLPLALTVSGNEAAHRSWPFLYVGVALAVAWSTGLPLRRRASRVPALRHPFFVAAVAGLAVIVLAVGNITSVANVSYRFPGPYLFGSDNRFQTAELDDVAHWLKSRVAVGDGLITDRFTGQELLAATRITLPSSSQAAAYGIYNQGSGPGPVLRTYLRDHNFKYFVLDTRILTKSPTQSFFPSYHGDLSVNRNRLALIKDNQFMTLIHKTNHYEVFRLNP